MATDGAQAVGGLHLFSFCKLGHVGSLFATNHVGVQAVDLCLQRRIDGGAAGDDKRLVAGATLGYKHAILNAYLSQLTIADVIAVVT